MQALSLFSTYVPPNSVHSNMAGIGISFFALLSAVILIMSVAVYIIEAIGIYKIAKARDLEHPWISFIPVANSYLLGKIADDIAAQYGQRKKYRVILLVTGTGYAIMTVFSYFLNFSQLSVLANSSYHSRSLAAGAVLSLLFMFLIFFAVGVVHLVFSYIAIYKIFQYYQTRNATAFLVLSIVIPICLPIFVIITGFEARKQGKNMPAPPIAYQPYQPVWPQNGVYYGTMPGDVNRPQQSDVDNAGLSKNPQAPGNAQAPSDAQGNMAKPPVSPDHSGE